MVLRILISISFCILSILIYYNLFNSEITSINTSSISLQPPKPTSDQMATLKSINWTELSKSNDSAAKFNALELISSIVQDQLTKLQNPTNCSQIITLKCGRPEAKVSYDFASHSVQHTRDYRIACLMASYSLGIPLSHDDDTVSLNGCPINRNWSDVFRPLGSSCQPGPNTFTVEWNAMKRTPTRSNFPLRISNIYLSMSFEESRWAWASFTISRKPCLVFCENEVIGKSLVNGLATPPELANLIELVHSDPKLWWTGQFMKYGLKLREDVRSRVDADKERIGLVKKSINRPLVGLIVHYTDEDESDSVHPLEQYFQQSKRFYPGFEELEKQPFFISYASGDVIVREEMEKYTLLEWKLYRFHKMYNVDSSLRDLMVLFEECDYIVCGYSSDLCQLYVEMLSIRFLEPWNHISNY